MQTRLVEYFLPLEREGHFARAAARCNVSQPTLSAGIATLEAQLGKRLIRRDPKYAGLTDEGVAILPWARQLIAAAEALGQAYLRSEEHTSELQSLMRISYAVFCLKKKNNRQHIKSYM